MNFLKERQGRVGMGKWISETLSSLIKKYDEIIKKPLLRKETFFDPSGLL